MAGDATDWVPVRMTSFGYTPMTEQSGPRELVRYAATCEPRPRPDGPQGLKTTLIVPSSFFWNFS